MSSTSGSTSRTYKSREAAARAEFTRAAAELEAEGPNAAAARRRAKKRANFLAEVRRRLGSTRSKHNSNSNTSPKASAASRKSKGNTSPKGSKKTAGQSRWPPVGLTPQAAAAAARARGY